MFNALKYTQAMEQAGFSREQAEVSMKVLIDVMNENFATKSDMKELEITLRSDMKELGTSLRSDIQQVRTELKTESITLRSEIRELENRLTIKLGAMLTVGIGVFATLVKVL